VSTSDGAFRFSPPRQPLPRRLTSDSVATYISELIFRGEIRANERIDRDAIAKAMGVSRSPVQEALIRLETDGFVRMEYHRGAYVAPFDTPTVKEHFDIYGVLAGMASANAAKNVRPEDLARLQGLADEIESAGDPESQAILRGEFRVAAMRAGSGHKLLMTVRSMNGLLGLLHGLASPTPPVPPTELIQREFTAIKQHRPSTARSTAIKIVDLVAVEAIRQLTLRGVLDGSAPTTATTNQMSKGET
jgi:DNA-binding GntR family transcriptional regulator